MKITRLFAAIITFAVLAGCVSAPITIRNAAQQPVNVDQGRKLSASGCGFQLLMFIPIGVNGRAERAFESIKEMADKNTVLADVKIRERWNYAFIGTVYCTDIQAVAYPLRTAAAVPAAPVVSKPTNTGEPVEPQAEKKP
jgi:hypothetical protein